MQGLLYLKCDMGVNVQETSVCIDMIKTFVVNHNSVVGRFDVNYTPRYI